MIKQQNPLLEYQPFDRLRKKLHMEKDDFTLNILFKKDFFLPGFVKVEVHG